MPQALGSAAKCLRAEHNLWAKIFASGDNHLGQKWYALRSDIHRDNPLET
jgi:hypothetical protein